MPAVSKKQYKFFRAVLSGKIKGVSKNVAKEFVSKTKSVKSLPLRKKKKTRS